MGQDKAMLEVGGTPIALRAAAALAAVASPIVVVGAGVGGAYEVVSDDRRGPLAAFVAGAERLRREDPVLLLACDVPFASPALLAFIAESLGDADAAVPVAGGRDQPLAACYGPSAVRVARDVLSDGRSAMRDLLRVLRVTRISETEWAAVAKPEALMDVDTPEDLARARGIADGAP
jgi:molybdopterin-guanine dinucleotide biosynthesis protein A